MPMLKTIAGHTSARGICRYLTRKNRALASDYINIDVPEGVRGFDWAEAMDATRCTFGNDLPWRGKRVRTYKLFWHQQGHLALLRPRRAVRPRPHRR